MESLLGCYNPLEAQETSLGMNNAQRLEVNSKLKRNDGTQRSLPLVGELSKCNSPRSACSSDNFYKD